MKKTNSATTETVGARLDSLTMRLGENSDTSGLDAQVLVAHVLKAPRSVVLAHPEVHLSRRASAALDGMLARLEKGEPLPYILGKWEFFGMDFEISPEVLIPRPETELLVEKAISWLNRNPDRRSAVDVGTGSGCIAIALAVNIPDLSIVATDISRGAIQVARRNAKKHSVAKRVTCSCSDLIPADGATYDLIVANLPYIPTNALHGLTVYGREPTLALDGGVDGLDLIRRLLRLVPDTLRPGGMMLMEIESSQGPHALSLAFDAFTEAEIHLHKDISGHDRLLEILV